MKLKKKSYANKNWSTFIKAKIVFMKKSLLVLSVLFIAFSCKKETAPIDTIQTQNQKNIQKWFNASISLSKGTPDTIAFYANKMEQAALKEPSVYKAMVALIKGIEYANTSSYAISTKYYDSALRLLKTTTADTLWAKAYNGLGNNYKITGDYTAALKNLFKALAVYEKKQDKIGICNVHAGLGEVYFQKDNLGDAKKHLTIAMNTLAHDKSNQAYLSAAHILANVYGMSGDFDSALKIDEVGIKITDSINNPKIKSSFLDNKANCFLFSNRLDSAQYYFNECLKIDLAGGNKKQLADTYSNLGELFLMKNNFAKAEEYALKSVGVLKSIDGKPNLGKSYGILTEIYTKQRKFEKALEIQKLQFENKSQMINLKKEASEAEYKIVYETQKKENKIQFLQEEEKIKELKIKQQHYQIERRNFLIVFFILLIGVLIGVGYLWRSKQKLRDKIRKNKIIQKTEEQIRLKMAKDIHDDLGSGLSKINFLSEIISQKTKDIPEIISSSESIRETSKSMIDNMRDLIWALNPENTTLSNFIARIREYTTDYVEDYSIETQYDIPENIAPTPIKNEMHRALFLVVKETINNIAKHSKATKIEFSAHISPEYLTLTIQDNGVGFEDSNTNGNGLKNIKSRIEDIGGKLTIESTIGAGTTVIIKIKLDKIYKK